MLFKQPALKQLEDQLTRFSPIGRRAQQKERAEKFLGEVDLAKQYPYQLVVFRITGYRPSSYPDLLITGDELRHDLPRLIISLASSQPTTEPVYTIDEVSKQWNVSTKTVRRWKKLGLIGQKFMRDGKRKIGFTHSEVERFTAGHHDRIERGSRFSQLTEEEKTKIIKRAKRMARMTLSNLTEISIRIARRMGRSAETVRYTIKNFDKINPACAIFPRQTGPLTRESRNNIFNSYHRGEAVDTLAKRFQRNRASMYRVINEVRAERLLEQPLDYMFHESFTDPVMEPTILAPMPGEAEYLEKRKSMKAPKDVPLELAPLYEVPLLSKDQEQHLFRKMNYLKHKAAFLRNELTCDSGEAGINASKIRVRMMDEIGTLLLQANMVKDHLISANMRLVVNVAKRHQGQSENFFDLISDGNMSLIRAVEKFDFSRGFKFSTYATWAIMKNFARSIPGEIHQKERFVTGHEEIFSLAPDHRTDERDLLVQKERANLSVNRLLDYLEPREREIVRLRAGLDDSQKESTLEEIGQKFGITKERVRQIHARSMRKLRDIVEDKHLEMP